MELTSIERELLLLIRFFDQLGYALTCSQILKYLPGRHKTEEVIETLGGDRLANFIDERNGFYFSLGHGDLPEKRLSNYLVGIDKLKRARRMSGILKYFPWIKAIAIYGSLSFYNPRAEGDIDLFIIGASGRLWSARFFVNAFMKLFGLRPTEAKKKNKICPSYWVAEDDMNLQLTYGGSEDYFYRYCGVSSFWFIYDEDKIADKFFSANSWIRRDLPRWQPFDGGATLGDNLGNRIIKKILALAASLLAEKTYQAWQMKILPERYKAIQNKDQRVIIGDKIIKLHDNDRGESRNQEFKQTMANFFGYAAKL
ncbi:MAG: hypothetical protein WC516_02970 [Patescibacteria group bacterium]